MIEREDEEERKGEKSKNAKQKGAKNKREVREKGTDKGLCAEKKLYIYICLYIYYNT